MTTDSNFKLNYDDITIVPEIVTSIESRKECNPYDENGYLPIFASCMSSVVSMENVDDFDNARILTVLPRTYSFIERLKFVSNYKNHFVAVSLQEAEEYFISANVFDFFKILNVEVNHMNICIDIANGHMKKLLNVAKNIKDKYGSAKITIMAGNIANPKTYLEYDSHGIDYVRCSIGTGNCCSTSSNTGIHFPVFSLLKEIYELKKANNCKCKIIADGGIKGFRDIQKALIYADYVMIGSLFNKAIESAGKTTYGKSYFNIRGFKIFRPIKTLLTYGKEIKRQDFKDIYKNEIKTGKLTAKKEVFGMSTKKAQAQIQAANGIVSKLKTAEGLIKHQNVEFDIAGWAENETDYLRSAMSYTDSRTLEEYKDSEWVTLTQIKYNN